MKSTRRPLPKRTEANKEIRRSINADTDDNCYFRSRIPEEDSGTSGSEVSPFGSSQPAVKKKRPRYRKSEVPGTPAVDDAKDILWERDLKSPPLSLKSARPETGRNVSEWRERRPSLSAPAPSQLQPSHPAEPPRLPKDGMEWVWFSEGYWAERESKDSLIVDRTPTQANPIRMWFNNVPKSQFVMPFREDNSDESLTNIKIGSLNTKKSSSKGSSRRQSERRSADQSRKSRQSLSAEVNKTKHQSRLSSSNQGGQVEGNEGLYSKAKRTIEARLFRRQHHISQVSDDEVKGPPSRTTTLLEGTTEPLKRFYHEQHDRDQKRQQPSENQPCTSSDRRGYRGLAPWHRRQSHESLLSVSSSIHKILMGRSPIGTPVSEKSSGSRSMKHISKFDPSDPKADTFLPSEAKRIKTPPMPRSPGFVYGAGPMLSPTSEGAEHAQWVVPSGVATEPRSAPIKPPNSRSSPSRKTATSSKEPEAGPMRIGRSSSSSNNSELEINVPEHFPTSPLCPKNPKHKSGGRGVCVYHGRTEGGGRGLEETQSEK